MSLIIPFDGRFSKYTLDDILVNIDISSLSKETVKNLKYVQNFMWANYTKYSKYSNIKYENILLTNKYGNDKEIIIRGFLISDDYVYSNYDWILFTLLIFCFIIMLISAIDYFYSEPNKYHHRWYTIATL